MVNLMLQYHPHILKEGSCVAVGTNGLLLDVVDRMKLPVKLREFRWAKNHSRQEPDC